MKTVLKGGREVKSLMIGHARFFFKPSDLPEKLLKCPLSSFIIPNCNLFSHVYASTYRLQLLEDRNHVLLIFEYWMLGT